MTSDPLEDVFDVPETPNQQRQIRNRFERQLTGFESFSEPWRDAGQVDIDRVWYAPEFARLAGVTQVVPPQDDYVFHDRLTHSVKVAQVAASLARKAVYDAFHEANLSRLLAESQLSIDDWIAPEHCYVAGLAHDIGHPPYGHAGEAALQQMFNDSDVEKLVRRSFEGNAQSTRIVAALSFRKDNQDGLDLTYRSLAAIAKYPWEKGRHPAHIAKLANKWSFYPEESSLLEALHQRGFICTTYKDDAAGGVVDRVYRWPEAEVMDWADDVSYAVHDIQDFYRANIIPLHRIAAAFLTVPQDFMTERAAEWSTGDFGFIGNDAEMQEVFIFARQKMEKVRGPDGETINEHIPAAFNHIKSIVDSIPTRRFDGGRDANTALQAFGSTVIRFFAAEASVEVIQVGGEARIAYRVKAYAQLVAEFFKAVCQYFVIDSSGLATMQHGQALGLMRTVEALTAMARQWVQKSGGETVHRTLPAHLLEYLRENFEVMNAMQTDSAVSAEIKIAVVDYLCGLRDLQATILQARLFGDRSSLNFANGWLDS